MQPTSTTTSSSAVTPPLRVAPPEQPGVQPTVLIMDDDRLMMRLAVRLLKGLHCTVVEARDGEGALDACAHAAAQGRPVMVAILDRCVPSGMGAAEVVGRLRSQEHAPVCVLFSGMASSPEAAEAQGFQHVLTKPFEIKSFLSTVEAAVQQWRALNPV